MMNLLRCFPSEPKCVGLCSSAAIAVLLATALCLAQLSQAQTEATLYSFKMKGSNNGTFPSAGLVRDSSGNLYGTTNTGGTFNHGTVCKLSGTTRTTLYTFSGRTDGGLPNSSLLRDAAGKLYGTTEIGGDLGCNVSGRLGCGTVFRLLPTGKLEVLHAFTGPPDGFFPSGLVPDSQGNLYGSTSLGGAANAGTVYKLDATRKETILYSFTGSNGGSDGANPNGLIRDSGGNLYGSTASGGPSNFGTVFRVDSTGKETVLFTFSGEATGEFPQGGLAQDPAGNLYGTTQIGGTSVSGIIFKIDPSGKETILHSFTSANGDGGNPQSTITRDAAGNLYGTTALGGIDDWGVVFKLDTADNETILHSFGSRSDGRAPLGRLIMDPAGHIWGVTQQGGAAGWGTVFEITP